MRRGLRRRSLGFTIVELLIVVAIIGILATISIIGYNGVQASARDKVVLADVETLEGLETRYGLKNGVAGKAWYSGHGIDADLQFTPSTDNVIDVGVSSGEYCIRAYNPKAATYKSYATAATKGSSSNACAIVSGSPIASNGGILTPPGNLTVTMQTLTQINVVWDSVAAADTYKLQYSTDSNFASPVTIDGITPTNKALNGLTTGATYYFRVYAVSASISSLASETVSLKLTNEYGSLATGTSIEGYWTDAPKGFLLEDGSAVSRTVYSDLFAVIGTTYGAGDGSTTFNLPDSRGRASVNRSPSDTEFDTMGEKTGSKTETLAISQLPSHTHTQNAHTHTQDAHTNTITDPGHNHTQNAHNHSQNAHNHNSTASNPYVSDGGFGTINVTSAAGGAYGFRYGGTNPAATATNQSTTATNNASYTGVTFGTTAAVNQSTTATNQNTGSGNSHNNIQPSIVKIYAIKFSSIDVAATTLPEGSSINGYWTTAPSGYLLEDGSAVSRATYPELFAIMGTTHGAGDGSTTFNLPDSRGRVSVNISADSEFNTIGEKYGEKSHILTIAEMASHTHIQNAHNHTQNAHTHSVSDPGHNHSQNAHNHTQNAHDHNLGLPNPYVNDNSFGGASVASLGGGDFGFKLGKHDQTIAVNNATTATNNSSSTGLGLYATTATNQSTTATNQNTGGNGAHNEIQPSIVRMSAVKATPSVNTGTSLAPGTSLGGYFTTAPSGYLLENGAAVSRSTYADLFSEIGTTYGAGNGSTTFNLPDSRGRTGVNKSIYDAEFNAMGDKSGTKAETLTIAQLPSHTHIQDAHTHIQDPHGHGVYDPGHNHSQNAHTHTQNAHVHGTGSGGYVSDGSLGGTLVFTAAGGSYGFYIGRAPSVVATNNATTATNNGSFTGVSINAITATNQSTTATNQNTGGGGAHNNIQPSIVKTFVIKY